MTVFISYQPGAKGKFITEICDLGTVPDASLTPKYDIHGGNIRWLEYPVRRYLHEHNIPNGNYHGLDPEELKENYTRYVDTILECLKTCNSKYAVDTHYVRETSLNYMLSKGAKVVRIITTDENYINKLFDNFFYKNFINKNKKNSIIIARHVIATTDTPIKEQFNYEMLNRPLNKWDKESLRMLYDISSLSIKKLQEPGIIVHENLLEVNSKELTDIDVLTKIVEFAGGTMNDIVKSRIEEYNNAQQDITTFDEYIEEFLNN